MGKIESPVTFGEWVKSRRRALDLTQTELAERSGCSVFALRKIESSERRPSKQLAGLLANSLEISADDLPRFLKVARGELNIERLGSANIDGRPIPQPPSINTNIQPLPSYPNRFIGRDQELSALTHLLQDPQCRLLTLIGPGGIGKTRLALEAASRCQPEYSDGVCFVSLAGLRSATYIIPAVIDSLGATFRGHDDPFLQLVNFLRSKKLLLVLDNAEHLLNGGSIIGELVEALPDIKVLVTSRERLHLYQEWVFEIQGMPSPAVGHEMISQDYSSVLLFVQAAKRAKVDFEPSLEDFLPISQICRMMEGMPLGIELAAGWVSVIPPAQISAEIDKNLDFLATTVKNTPERQRSLRAAFEYSWNLLPEVEQKVLARLSVFRGGFERSEAVTVAAATLPILQSLVSRSLVRRRANGRFDLHEVIRQYAYLELENDIQRDEILDRHSAAFLGFIEDRKFMIKDHNQANVVRELRNEINNIRTAWSHAVEHGNFDHLFRTLRTLGWFCDISGLLNDGIEMLGLVLASENRIASQTVARQISGVALGQLGLLKFRKGDFDAAIIHLEESIIRLRPLDNPDWLIDPLIIRGVIYHTNGDFDNSKKLFTEGLACARAAGNSWWEAYALYNLGYVDSLLGYFESGYDQMIRAVDQWRKLGDPSTLALGLTYLCPTALKLNKIDEVRGWLEESLTLCTGVGDGWGAGNSYRNLGLTAIARGQISEAIAHFSQSLDYYNELTVGWDQIRTSIYMAEAYRLKDDLSHARKILIDALHQSIQIHSYFLALDALAGLAQLNQAEGKFHLAFDMAYYVIHNNASNAFARELANQIASDMEAILSEQEKQQIILNSAGRNIESYLE